MADNVEKIKAELLELSKRYNTLTQVEDSSDNALAKLLELMVKEGMTESSVPMNITKVVINHQKNGHHRGSFNSLDCNFLPFSMRAEAVKALEHFKKFPEMFVRPISVVDYEGEVYLAVELFEAIQHQQQPSDERNKLLKNILRIAIKLDIHNQFNDGFEELVIANGQPKLCKPSDRSVDLKKQAAQLKTIMNNIVKPGCNDATHLRTFFYLLERAYTMTNLRDFLYHPVLMTSSERVFYLPTCMLVIHFTVSNINHKGLLCNKDPTWISKVKNSRVTGLIAALGYRPYGDTIFEWFQFGRNCYAHGNDKPLQDGKTKIFMYPFKDLNNLTNDLVTLFPELHGTMHTYMCAQRLYDEFDGQENRDSVQMTIHSKMEKITSHLPNCNFADFLDVIDTYDFVLAKISVHCRHPAIMESKRSKLMDDKKTVSGCGGSTMFEVRERIRTNKDAKAALDSLLRNLVFFHVFLCKLENIQNSTFQHLVLESLSESCPQSTFTDHRNQVLSYGLPDLNVVKNILQYHLVNDKEKKSFIKGSSMLCTQVSAWKEADKQTP